MEGTPVKHLPLGWLELLSFGGPVNTEEWRRAVAMPNVPITRLEYHEALAFTHAKED